MSELRPIPIILISIYSFLLGLFFFSVCSSTIFSRDGISDPFNWAPVISTIVLSSGLITAGVGILFYNQLCWKILFFFLLVFISNVISFILVFLSCLWLDAKLLFEYLQNIHVTAFMGSTLMAIFLSGIFAVYYLTREKVLSHFGDMGELLEPF